MENPFDQFDTEVSSENPFDQFDEKEEDKNTFSGVAKDVVRLVTSPFAAGLSAIGQAIGGGLAGQPIGEALTEGATKQEFLGASLEPESKIGKKTFEVIGEAFNKLHTILGDEAYSIFEDKYKINALRTVPGFGALADFYDAIPKEAQGEFKALVAAGASITPDIALTLMMGRGGKKGTAKLSDEDILKFHEEPTPKEVETTPSAQPYERFTGAAEKIKEQEAALNELAQEKYVTTREAPTIAEEVPAEVAPSDLAARGEVYSPKEAPEVGLLEAAAERFQPSKIEADMSKFGTGEPAARNFTTGKLGDRMGGKQRGAIEPQVFAEGIKKLAKYLTPKAIQELKNSPGYKARDRVVLMPVDTFLKNAASGFDPEKLTGVKAKFAEGSKLDAGDIPYLEVSEGKNGVAEVVGHEGRHRAQYLKSQGIDLIPVRIRSHATRWSEQTSPERFDYREQWPDLLRNQDRTASESFPIPREEAVLPNAGVYPTKLGETGFGKKQGGSWTPFAGKEKSLQVLSSTLSREDWIKEASKRFPDKSAAGWGAAYDKLAIPKKANKLGVSPTLYHAAANKIAEGLDETVGKGLGNTFMRLGRKDPQLEQGLVKHEIDVSRRVHENLIPSEEVFKHINLDPLNPASWKQHGEFKAKINSALFQGDFDLARSMVPPKIKQYISQMEKNLNSIGSELADRGLIAGKLENYFPRIITDLDGLKHAMGEGHVQNLNKLLFDEKGNALSPEASEKVITSYLNQHFNTYRRPGFAKSRLWDTVPPEFEKYYASPVESYNTYMRNAVTQLETANFFGRHLVKGEQPGSISTTKSIQSLLQEAAERGKITHEDIQPISEMLQARFGGGNKSSNFAAQAYKDITHLAYLGDIANAVANVNDIYAPFVWDGVAPTIQALGLKIRGKGLKAEDYGLMNRVSDEFISDKFTTKAVDKVFKATFFTGLDKVLKDVNLTSTYLASKAAAKSLNKSDKLFYEYQARFGDRFPQLLDDLKNGRKTALTDELVVSELAMRQPIFRSNFSEAYMSSPNVVRPALVLKSYMIQQANLAKVRSIDQIRAGNPARGMANLTKMAFGLALAGVAVDTIKDFLQGKPLSEVGVDEMSAALLKNSGLSEKFTKEFMDGNFGKASLTLAAPPLTFWDADSWKEGKWKKWIPLVGDEAYYRSPEGKKALREQERRKQQEARKARRND